MDPDSEARCRLEGLFQQESSGLDRVGIRLSKGCYNPPARGVAHNAARRVAGSVLQVVALESSRAAQTRVSPGRGLISSS
jgi:hypothetical protein